MRWFVARLMLLGVIGVAIAVGSVGAQSARLGNAVTTTDDGKLRFRFTAWPNVQVHGGSVTIQRSRNIDDEEDDSDWSECRPCSVHVTLTVRDGEVTRVRKSLGHRGRRLPRGVRDLGAVASEDAAAFLVRLAQNGRKRVAEEALDAAVFADDVVLWPDLLRIARNEERPHSVRKKALFWLGQVASDAVEDELGDLIDDQDSDVELRKHAVFALSNRPDDRSVPFLIRVARTNRSAEVRESAFFWLSQKDDPRVIEFLEEILAKNR